MLIQHVCAPGQACAGLYPDSKTSDVLSKNLTQAVGWRIAQSLKNSSPAVLIINGLMVNTIRTMPILFAFDILSALLIESPINGKQIAVHNERKVMHVFIIHADARGMPWEAATAAFVLRPSIFRALFRR